ncbi:MAG: oxidoreductase [Actinomycetales bacterium]|nr:oxidoreductase [Actinomycetales bacterium]
MNPWNLARRIVAVGRVAETAPSQPVAEHAGAVFGGSVQVRHVDAGSCNGCEIEVGAAFNPVYDTERYGARLVASPRHADVVLVTGVVTHNMAEPLRRTVEATPRPRLVLAVGDCAHDCGVFRGAFGVRGSVADVVDVDLVVPGCPPEPAVIVEALRRVTGR